jgi:hypothetical protein
MVYFYNGMRKFDVTIKKPIPIDSIAALSFEGCSCSKRSLLHETTPEKCSKAFQNKTIQAAINKFKSMIQQIQDTENNMGISKREAEGGGLWSWISRE